ncbi:YbhB/YbcL family Raf kinase inhibitor-like protein [Vibrio ponticus]|uniref:YbhB/YbcL family Raf kinase inhibitor-like protein n=1 Tax=Vibrio ponticus TaxID=265668 RepID=A0A3N3DTT8_9VIBR|nr:YbhB/YbcL family Raf kinase inhibitor-like protein [Vibrio ponticus]ROV57852.1 YbhB/YbcL family Raf kinase inhibitor-like protein [Vibrio ponticus]
MKRTLIASVLLAASFASSAMTLTSQDIQEGSRMADTYAFNGFGCSGDNLSPQLSWKDAPAGTKSFAITAYDPDAPTGSGWWHWVAVDIPTSVTSIEQGASSKDFPAKQMKNDYGTTGFGGVCPPKAGGMHRYQFTVWALPTEKLELPQGASNAIVGYMLNANALDKATLTATYVNE